MIELAFCHCSPDNLFVGNTTYNVIKIERSHRDPCSGLGPGHLVSWLRARDMTVLTVGGLVFSSDPRVSVTSAPGGRSVYQLEVARVRAEDAGRYTCQVNTDQELSLTVQLEVTGE